MSKYTVVLSKRFRKEYLKLSRIDQRKVLARLDDLAKNPFYPSFRTKKFHGRPGCYESSVNMDIRIFWYFKTDEIIFLDDVGHHDLVK